MTSRNRSLKQVTTHAIWQGLNAVREGVRALLPRPIRRWIRSKARRHITWRLFGTTSMPDHIRIRHGGRLYVSAHDNRAKRLLACHGVTQPAVAWAWRMLDEILAPTLLFDVGANYGEISLGCTYDAQQKLFLLEPNPSAACCLQKSISTHPSRDQIEILAGAAFERTGTITCVMDEKWSGTSSIVVPITDAAFKGVGKQTVHELTVPCITLDGITDKASNDATSLLLKLDVEGAEVPALKGGMRTLKSAQRFGIVLEYNRTSLQYSEPRYGRLWDVMESLGDIYLIRLGQPLQKMDREDQLGENVDLVVVSCGELLDRIGSVRMPYLIQWCA